MALLDRFFTTLFGEALTASRDIFLLAMASTTWGSPVAGLVSSVSIVISPAVAGVEDTGWRMGKRYLLPSSLTAFSLILWAGNVKDPATPWAFFEALARTSRPPLRPLRTALFTLTFSLDGSRVE